MDFWVSADAHVALFRAFVFLMLYFSWCWEVVVRYVSITGISVLEKAISAIPVCALDIKN